MGADTTLPMQPIPIGQGETLIEGDDVAIISIGVMAEAADRGGRTTCRSSGIRARVINARFAKPIDSRLILDAVAGCGAVVTVEENVVAGGFGSSVLELLAANGLEIPVATLGVPDRIFEQASQKRLASWRV